ncbi:MAG: hypothetical protein CMF42_04830 [Legionellales bacterium]|nr:hypothetical protein [Legionellales bacterium]OUX67342.1 MAG: hypothetical protein CBD38_03020 [bacterium TMED178]
MKLNHTIGAALLIAGTTIGAVTLALPIATTNVGLIGTSLIFISAWLVMYWSGLILAQVCVLYPAGKSFSYIAEHNFGVTGKMVSWISYGLLLLTLLMAYFSSLSSLINFNNVFFDSPRVGYTLVALMSWLVISMDTEFIDAMNRLMVYVLISTIIIMVVFLFSHVRLSEWVYFKPTVYELGHLLPVVVVGFGFQVILPSVRAYMKGQESMIPKAILIGSLIPLVIYLLWTCGVLTGMSKSDIQQLSFYSDETVAISVLLQHVVHGAFINLFVFAAVVSSLLGIALSLRDLLIDILQTKKKWLPPFLTIFLPWLMVNIHSAAFLEILRFSGLIVAFLNILFPAIILINERAVRKNTRFHIMNQSSIIYIVIIYALVVILSEVIFS